MSNSVPLKPIIKWVGGKRQLIPELTKNLPNFKKYCEPFVGGGAMLCHILDNYPVEEICICDANKALLNMYKTVINHTEDLITELACMEHLYWDCSPKEREEYYYKIRDKFNQCQASGVHSASCFIFLNKTSFNGLYRVNKKGQFNAPWNKSEHPLICDADIIRSLGYKLSRAVIFDDYKKSKDFIDQNTLVYFDPPYRPIGKTGFTAYTEVGFNDEQQIELAEFVKSIDAKIILSNSDPKNVNPSDDFFDNLYIDYNIRRIEARRSINSNGNGRQPVNELIISNF